MLKQIALGAALLCSSAYADLTVDGVNIIRAFDGKAANCKTQADFARTMRTGAYIISDLSVEVNEQNKLDMNMNVTTFHCVKNGDSFQFERKAPTDPLTYDWFRFNYDGQAQTVTITVEKKDVELIAVSDDYVLLNTSQINASRRGYVANLKVDILQAMSANQIQSLDNGETVKLRVGLMKRAKVRHISPDSVSDFRQVTGGTFYVFVNLRKDQDKITVELQ